jgi:flagellar biosynthesis/type III secretory pathway protein FliH
MQLWEEMAMSRQDGYDEGREVGYGEGREAGYDEGCAKINALTKNLMADNRTEDLLRAIEDTAYQEQLLKEYHL